MIRLKTKYKWKKLYFKKKKESDTFDHAILSHITLELSNAISFSKAKYQERLAITLNYPKTTPKTYWSILKTFDNGSKLPLIPPLLVTDEFVNEFFSQTKPV